MQMQNEGEQLLKGDTHNASELEINLYSALLRIKIKGCLQI